MNLQRERDWERDRAGADVGVWALQSCMVWFYTEERRSDRKRTGDLQRGHEEKECLLWYLHTSCCHVQEYPVICRTKTGFHLLQRMTLCDRTKKNYHHCLMTQYLPGTCSTSTRQHVIEMLWMSPSSNVVYPSCVCGRHIDTVAWSYPQRCSLLHSPLDFIHICGYTAQAYTPWQTQTSINDSRKKTPS